MNITELINKRVLIVGLGITGLSVVRYLSRHEVPFELADEHASDEVLERTGRQARVSSCFHSSAVLRC